MTKPPPPRKQRRPHRLPWTLGGKKQTPPPVWLMRQAGRYLPEYQRLRKQAGNFLNLCYTPELAVEGMLQPVERFGLDASILFSDVLVVPDALGVEVAFVDGDGPRLQPVRTVEDVAALRPERVCDYLRPVFDTVAIAADTCPKDVALIGFAGAPWTVACYMVEGHGSRDFAVAKAWAIGDPEGFQQLINVLVDATAAYLIEQVRCGAEAVQLFDTWAGLLSEADFERWCIAPTRALVDKLRAVWPNIPVIGFPRGAGLMLTRFAEATEVNAVSIDSGVPLSWAARELQNRWVVQGNLDPVSLRVGGDVMVSQIHTILEALGYGPFVFNLGHGLLPDTPPENVGLLVDTVHAWRPGDEGVTAP